MKRLLFAAILCSSLPLAAQSPSDDWRTFSTAHFRVHYPAAYEAWTRRAASRLESVREAVVHEVGNAPEQITDVLVMNPYSSANGETLALLDTPRIILYTEAPEPDSELGQFRDWIDVLSIHEMTHLVHLLRPSRDSLLRLLPLNPITLKAPRWALEGYATVVEGRLTGSGRPNSAIRAAILRKWADAGRLPAYGRLNSDSRFLGGSMAYLVGSAYLEWLEQRSGEGSLKKLWIRLTARQRRTFDQAFEGVFGEKPEKLYGIFTAELTARAMDERMPLHEGALWQETRQRSGDPAVSPDGSRLAMVIRQDREPSRIVIFSTSTNAEEEKYEERVRRMLARDPEDVPSVRTKPFPRTPLSTYAPPDGGDVSSPRWTADGNAIVFSHRMRDANGDFHHDLFRWIPSSGRVVRITRLADVHDADPFPDGRRAVAVRTRFGYSQLVLVDLGSGEVTALDEPSLDRVDSHPRVSSDGSRIAVAEHREGGWRVVVHPIPGGQAILPVLFPSRDAGQARAPVLQAENAFDPAWTADNQLVATVARGGSLEIHRLTAGGSEPLTRSEGAALSPAPARDGSLYFMSLEPDGFVVRRLASLVPLPSDGVPPLLAPAPSQPVVLREEAVPPGHAYGLGRQERQWLVGGNSAPAASNFEAGLRLGDVVGRLDTVIIGSIGGAKGPTGAAVSTLWRGWPVAIGATLFDADEKSINTKRRGAELRAEWERHASMQVWRVDGGANIGQLQQRAYDLVFADTSIAGGRRFGSLRVDQETSIGAAAGTTAGDSWQLYRGSARLGAKLGSLDGNVSFAYGTSSGATSIEVGGLPLSIVPDSAMRNRVFDPALFARTLTGRRYRGERIELEVPGLGGTAFWQRHDVSGSVLTVVGYEVSAKIEAMPLVKTPALDFTAGAGRLVEQHRTRMWVGVRWRA